MFVWKIRNGASMVEVGYYRQNKAPFGWYEKWLQPQQKGLVRTEI